MHSPRPRILLAFHWYLESLHEGALRRAAETGREAVVLNSDSLARLAGSDFDGIVGMLPPDPDHPVRRFVAASGKPVVELSLAYPESNFTGRCPEDCAEIGKKAAGYLRGLPVASFAFVSGGRWWNHDARYAAFRAALADDARPCDRFDTGGTGAAATTRLADFLKSLPKPVAIFGSVDEWARLALDAAGEAELSVPGDAFILGFGNRELVSRVAPTPLSSIDIDYAAWGAAAVSLLDDLIARRAAPGAVRPFAPGEVVVRASTGGESGGDPLRARAFALMRANLSEPLKVGALAGALKVSKATLERAFAGGDGAGVARRYLEVRIDAAKARLAAGEKTESVATSVGFLSYRGFVRAFSKITGVSPGAWVRRR